MAVVTVEALRETAEAFDGVAGTYDRSNRENALLSAMRERTRAALETSVPTGSRILDLGCGPGTDVVYFARRGYHVTAIDWSTAMVEEARRQLRACGADADACVQHLGIDQLSAVHERGVPLFDGVYSSFGALNCATDVRAAAWAMNTLLRPDGVVVASVIGRYCPWEIALYSAKGDWRRAFLRWRRDAVPVPLEGRTVWTRYYSPRSFVASFRRSGFVTTSVRALGLLTPPPYMQAFAGRHPRAIGRLRKIEEVIASWPVARHCGDHFLVVMRKQAAR